MIKNYHFKTLGLLAIFGLCEPAIVLAGESSAALTADKVVSQLTNANTVKWQKYGFADGADFYADPDNVKRTGNLVYTKVLFDQSKTAGYNAGSGIEIVVYDCANRTYTNLSAVNYSGRMGSGAITKSRIEPRPAAPIVVGTVAENAYNFACNFVPYISPHNRFKNGLHNDSYMRQD